ncbi:hypothetical protein N9A86_04945 [Akkermansiaceae bacterium]|nr:hypothetical protein [Akkermansiaceae bacterium]MDB4544681.1 hypothetical protein [Akkermansiaceae bacterium]
MEKESVSQWMDADAVRALAESLLKPAPESADRAPEVDLGEDFVGFVEAPGSQKKANQPAELARKSLSDAQSRASSAGVIPSAASRAESLKKVVMPKPPQSATTKSSQVVYVSKTKETSPYPPASRIESPFKIAPNQVLPPIPGKSQIIFDRQNSLESFGRWLKKNIPTESFFICHPDGRVAIDEIRSEKLIGVARDLVSESTDGSSSHHVKIGPDKVLEVIEVKAERGTNILGILVPRPLSESAVAAVSNALIKALAKL